MRTIFHPLQDQDRAPLDAMREAAAPARGMLDPEMRAPFDTMLELTPAHPQVDYEESRVGGVSGWWCHPSRAAKSDAILYFHGGAYLAGSPRAYRHFVGQIAARAGAAAFAAEYGLAPEHPFPAAVQDASAAYRGLAKLGFERIAIVGDSAGGGLALAILSLMTAGSNVEPLLRPRCAVAMSPWTDLTLTGDSMETKAEADPILTREALAKAAGMYLVNHDARDPKVAPLFGDLTDLPPVRIHVGENEVLLDDSRRYAEKFAGDADHSQLHIWEGMPHVFPSSVGTLAAASAALDDIGGFLRQHLQAYELQ